MATSAPERMPPETMSWTSAVHAELLQRLDRLRDRGEDRDADVLDEHVLGGGGAALHAVEHDHVGARLDRQRDVVVRAATRRP